MNAKKKLAKDILVAFLGFLIMWMVASAGGNTSSADMVMCLFCSGLVFGWKIASHIITAVSLWGISIKFLISVVIGIFAMPCVLIADVVNVVREHQALNDSVV